MKKGKKTIRLTESEMITMIERIVNEVKREKRDQITESRRRMNNRRYNSQLNEQVTTEIDVKKTMPRETAALSTLFKQQFDKLTQKVSGIIGPYYLASDSMSESGYMGSVFGFESTQLGGSSGREETVPVMTLPIPFNVGDFTWSHVVHDAKNGGFRVISVYKETVIRRTDQDATDSSVAAFINDVYNQTPIDVLRAIYNNDKNKASYDTMIANFKTLDLKRNKKIGSKLTGNAKEFFA
jgi:hypothetical protein